MSDVPHTGEGENRHSGMGRSEALVWLAAIVAMGCFVALGEALVFGEAPGTPSAEAPGHLWLLAQACEQIFQGNFIRLELEGVNHPWGSSWVMMDPINTLWGVLPYWAAGGGTQGAVWAANAVVFCNLGLAAVGGYVAGRHFGGSRAGGVLAAGAICLAPALLGMISTGYTEKIPVGWMALHWVALDRLLLKARVGKPWRDRLPGLLAAVGFGAALCYSGWYLTVGLYITSGLLCLARLSPSSGTDLRARGRVLAAGVGVAVGVFLTLLPLIGAMQESSADAVPKEEMSKSIEAQGDRDAGLPGIEQLGFELQQVLPYVGRASGELNAHWGQLPLDHFRGAWTSGVLVVLIGLGVGLGRRDRRLAGSARVVGLLVVGSGLLMLGDELLVGGRNTGIPLPVAGLVAVFPKLGMVSFWGKFSVVWAMALGLAAAVAVSGLTAAKQRFGVRLGVLCLAAELVLSTGYLPFAKPAQLPNSYSASMPKDMAQAYTQLEIASDTPVLQLPLNGNSASETQGGIAWHYLLWQLDHGRPVATNAEAVVDDKRPELGQRLPEFLNGLGIENRSFETLQELGYGAVFLHLDAARSPRLQKRRLTEVLGEPHYISETLLGWTLP